MNLEKNIVNAWQRQSWWLWLLLPFSLLYGLVMRLRQWGYRRGIFASYKAPVPVMVIGNITVGGSGKTPLIIALVKYLQTKDINVGVISRGYGAQVTDSAVPRLVSVSSVPAEVGDEPCLIVSETAVPMAVGSNRQASIELLLQHFPDTQLILSDDGLQHLALQRDVEWIVYDAHRGLGSEMLLPVGFLRESVSRLKTAPVIYHGDNLQTLNMQLDAGDIYALSTKQSDLLSSKSCLQGEGETVHAVCGIGYPSRFFDSLKSLGFNVIEHPFPDHHDYVLTDIQFDDDLPIMTTTKDAVKLKQVAGIEHQQIWVLPVQAKLSDGCYALLDNTLDELMMV